MAYNDLISTNLHNSIKSVNDLPIDVQIPTEINKKNYSLSLKNIKFDEKYGFIWDNLYSIDTEGKDFPIRNYSKLGPSFVVGLNNDSFDVKFDAASTDNLAISNSSQVKSKINFLNLAEENNYYSDLQKLMDEYFWTLLEKRLLDSEEKEKSNKETLFNYIKNNNLTDDVSVYLSYLIDSYNISYQKNLEVINNLSKENQHDFSSRRYLICTSDSLFEKNVEDNMLLLEMRVSANNISNKNIRGDKAKSFLSNINNYQEMYDLALNEFGWRISDEKYVGKGAKSKTNVSYSTGRLLNKEFKKLYENLSKGLISEEQKKYIDEYEQKKFKGTITVEENNHYNQIVSDIEREHKVNLQRIENLYSLFSSNGLGDSQVNKYSREGTSISFTPFIEYHKTNFKHFEFNKENDISPELVHMQNNNLDKEINKALDKVIVDGKEMIRLDAYKQAIINKIDFINNLPNSELKGKEIKLLSEDLKKFYDYQYTIEVTCGIKNTYLNEIQESQKRALLGENYQYLSFNAFLDKIEEISNQKKEDFLIDAKITTFEEAFKESFSDVFVNTDYSSEEDKLFFTEVKNYLLGENDSFGIKVEDEIKKILDVNNEYSIDSLEKFLLESNNDKILEALSKPIKDEYLKEVMKYFTLAEDTVKKHNAEIVASNERIIAAETILESINSDINHRIRNENSKKQLENQMNQIINGVSPSGAIIDGGLGKELFKEADLKKIFFKSDGNYIDVKKILEVRKSIIRILDEVNEEVPSVDDNVKYKLNSETIQKIKDTPVLKEALYDKLVIIEEQFLDYKVARKEGEKAIYIKPEIAGDALVRAIDEIENLQEVDLSSIYNKKNKEIEDNIQQVNSEMRQLEKEIKEKQNDLEDIEYELEETKSKKALKALEEEKADLEEDIRLLKEDFDLLHERSSHLEKEKSNYDIDIQSDISINDERDKAEAEITAKDKEYLRLLMKKRDLLENEGLNSNDNKKQIEELDEIIEDLQSSLKEKGVDIEDIDAAEVEENNSKFNVYKSKIIGSLKRLKKDSEDEMSDLEKIENKINATLNDRFLLVEKLELINMVDSQFFDSSRDIYDKLQKDLIRSMEKDTFTEINKENVQTFYSSLSPELKNIRIIIDTIYTDKENNYFNKDGSNRAFDITVSSMRDIPKEDFLDFVNKNNSERIDFIEKSIPKDSKGIYIALNTVLQRTDAVDNTREKKELSLLKPELIESFEKFFETQKIVYQENQDKLFNISEYKESINEYLRDCSLIPLNINATNKLFEKLNNKEDILVLSVGDESFNLSSDTLNEFKEYLKKFDENKLSPEKVQMFNSIIKGLETEGVDSLKISLNDSVKENLKVTLKAYGDENSVLILTGFNDFETKDIKNISINAERLYSVDSIVDNLGKFISEDELKENFKRFEENHPNQFVQQEPLTIHSSVGEINDVLVLNEVLNNQDTLNIDDVNAFLKSIKEEGTTIQEFIRDSYEDDDYNKSLLERLSQLKGLDTEYKKAIEEVLIDDYGADIDNIRSQELLRQIEELDKSPKEIQKESEEVKKENEELKKTNEEFKKELAETKEENANLRKDVEELKKMMAELMKTKENDTSKAKDSSDLEV